MYSTFRATDVLGHILGLQTCLVTFWGYRRAWSHSGLQSCLASRVRQSLQRCCIAGGGMEMVCLGSLARCATSYPPACHTPFPRPSVCCTPTPSLFVAKGPRSFDQVSVAKAPHSLTLHAADKAAQLGAGAGLCSHARSCPGLLPSSHRPWPPRSCQSCCQALLRLRRSTREGFCGASQGAP